jgi:succinylarginine dihydrolase
MRAEAREYQFDGIVGPTHNYAGLSPGNLAATKHAGQRSDPRAAALQGLEKMRFVAGLGVGQAVLPPHPRPDVATLRTLGFGGSDAEVLAAAAREDDLLLRLCSSASAMWTANAATVAPSADTEDARVHLTPANLSTMFHRAREAPVTTAVLRRIFSDPAHFEVHDPLPAGAQFADEGAANHTRLCTGEGTLHLFGWGRMAWPRGEVRAPTRYPARQTLEASAAVARLHRLRPGLALPWQQDPEGIDAGAFHTDVLAVGNGAFLMLHDRAFVEPDRLLATLRERLGPDFTFVRASERELPAADAVAAYPFNSQVLTLPSGRMAIVAPSEAREQPRARAFLERVVAAGGPVEAVHYRDVKSSMDNGGGPACLRLRVALTDEERAAAGARVFLDDALYADLRAWIERRYRDRLAFADLADPALLDEVRTALDELTALLRLGAVYDFQRA